MDLPQDDTDDEKTNTWHDDKLDAIDYGYQSSCKAHFRQACELLLVARQMSQFENGLVRWEMGGLGLAPDWSRLELTLSAVQTLNVITL